MFRPRCAKARTTSAVTAALAAEFVVALAAELAAVLVAALVASTVFVCVSPSTAEVGGTVAVGAAPTPSIHAPLADCEDFKNKMPLSIASRACANVAGEIGTRLAFVATRRITGGGGANETVAAGIFSVVARAAVDGATC